MDTKKISITPLIVLIAVIIFSFGFSWYKDHHVEDVATGADFVGTEEIKTETKEAKTDDTASVLVTFISYDDGQLMAYLSQHNAKQFNMKMKALDSDGNEMLTSEQLNWRRGDDIRPKLGIKCTREELMHIASIDFEIEGAEFDASGVDSFLINAKRAAGISVGEEALEEASKLRIAAAEERERIRQEEEARRLAEEEAKKKAEEEERMKNEVSNRIPETWVWGDEYALYVLQKASDAGSLTEWCIVNDLEQLRLSICQRTGDIWKVTYCCNVNRNGAHSGAILPGVAMIIEKAPTDGNGAYHANGAGVDDWMSATNVFWSDQEIDGTGLERRYMEGSGFWEAYGFCRGYERSWFNGDRYGGDATTYLEETDAKWIYDNVGVRSTVVNV